MKEKEIYTNNMVTLDKIPFGKPIIVEFDGELKGIVCEDKFVSKVEPFYRLQWSSGLSSEACKLSDLISLRKDRGYTFKVQLKSGEPLQEIISGDNWAHIDDILHRDLVLVKKDGEIIGMVQFHDGDYFVSAGIDVWEQDLGYCSSKQSLIERGNERGYSFFLQVNDTQ